MDSYSNSFNDIEKAGKDLELVIRKYNEIVSGETLSKPKTVAEINDLSLMVSRLEVIYKFFERAAKTGRDTNAISSEFYNQKSVIDEIISEGRTM